MNLLVVVLLGGLWAWILIPGLRQGRRVRSPLTTIDSFERSMGILASDRLGRLGPPPTPGRHVLVIHDPPRFGGRRSGGSAVQRRRRVLAQLVGLVASSGLLALVGAGIFRAVFALSVVALGAYVGLLVHVTSTGAAGRRTVHRLPRQRTATATATVASGLRGRETA